MTAVVVIYVVPEFIVIFEIGYHDLYYHWLNFIICTIIIHYQSVSASTFHRFASDIQK